MTASHSRNRLGELGVIEESIRNCQLCPLSKSRTNAVPGEGSYDARLMILGEAPGRKEDILGRPFVGRAGKFLRETLGDAGISASNVYITNIVRCRPPENRRPKENEWKTCTSHYLWKQIELIKPDIVCLLGATAVRAILGKKSPGLLRGKTVEKAGQQYWVTYHPAAALYNVKQKTVIRGDLRKLKRLLDTKRRSPRKVRTTACTARVIESRPIWVAKKHCLNAFKNEKGGRGRPLLLLIERRLNIQVDVEGNTRLRDLPDSNRYLF